MRVCVSCVSCVCWPGTPTEDDGDGGGGGGGGGDGVAAGSSGCGWLRPDMGALDGARGTVDLFYQSWHTKTYRIKRHKYYPGIARAI